MHGTDGQDRPDDPVDHRGPARACDHGAIARTVRTTDTALTILAVLDITAPSNCTGKSVSEIYEAP